MAIQRHDYQKVEACITEDPMAVDRPLKLHGCDTPLFIALRCRCPPAIIRLLLQRGASLDPNGSGDQNPLSTLAASTAMNGAYEDQEFMEAMYAPALLDAQFHFLSVLDAVQLPGYPPVKLQKLSQPLPQNKEIKDNDAAIAKILLKHGADPWQKDSNGVSAIDHAEQHCKSELAQCLRDWFDCLDYRLQLNLGILPLPDSTSRHIYRFLLPGDIG